MPTPSPTTYALADVMRHTGAKRPQIEYWVRKGLIRGEFEHGTGLPRQFVFRNLVEIATAVHLTKLGLNTEGISSLLNSLRYGDVEADVRTAWFVESTSRPAIGHREPTQEEERELNERMKALDEITPREEHCCADLNDDGTLKLLRLLRSYTDEGVSDAAARKALLAVAREHIADGRRWEKENDAFHKRWRQFKNPKTRPASAQFFLVATLHSSEDERDIWSRANLTDFKDPDDVPRDYAAIVVPMRQILERLEKATDDSWPATAEREVYRMPGIQPTAKQLVDQAFKEYEKTERIKELRALGKLPPAKEHHHHG